MFIEKIMSKGLAHNSYFAGDEGEAFVIDPRRDVDTYINIANSRCNRILFVFETHRNEDYLIGSLELEKLTGCRIIHGSHLDFNYGEAALEGDIFNIGGMTLEAIETPGHSPESLSYVLYQGSRKDIPLAVFTGDALFYGSVGRTDLLSKNAEFASILYDSLYGKLLPLGNHVIIYPAHGSGSACGSKIADVPISTLGYELAANPMLGLPREEFIERKKKEAIPLPPYFARMSEDNLKGPPLFDRKRIEPLGATMFENIIPDCIILDTRSPYSFASGHIAGSYNIWLEGLARFAGWVLEYGEDILLVTERQEDVETARLYLTRMGFDRIRGYLCKGIQNWQNLGMPLEQSGVDTVEDLNKKLKEKKDIFLLDVRGKDEYDSGHIPGAVNIYVGELEGRLQEIPLNRPVVSICSVGNRAGLGASILKRHGYDPVFNLLGGMTAWKEKDYPTEFSKKIPDNNS